MGVGIFRNSSCACIVVKDPTPVERLTEKKICCTKRKLPNPNPKNFEITRIHQTTKDWCVVEVKYPDATNYEGRKVMLYRSSISVVACQNRLDPHFCDEKDCLSPFARFEPTPEGWDAAVTLALTLQMQSDIVTR
jgi:hypothetical protein